ncbi:CoA transferase [Pseudonocardia sp. WMMC193]|uniref:CoA transferase n=1 Tax=Pseudonocardia sp. WMMC193 TaxID=2911965 RepID=UPI001F00BBA1|nr:CoA transferase [Pseudonocardia sp. WMMC193]MCF7550823.1 CoA transferase [Pseudonocardia sp. WMMC193]
MSAGSGPLSGIRVLDLSTLAPGPFATTLLGDLGADVITLEAPPSTRPGSGMSQLGAHGGREARRLGLNPLYRPRRSIVVNLEVQAGLDIALRLAARSDVFVEGFRPGVCERLGPGYPALSATTPGPVYCSLTGYGQTGELAQHAGHDLDDIAESGLLAAGTRDGRRPGIPVDMAADYAAGGLLAAFGIVAALAGRASTGRGVLPAPGQVGPVPRMTPQMAAEMVTAPDRVDADDGIGALVIRGAEGRFCAGAHTATLGGAGNHPAEDAGYQGPSAIYQSFTRVGAVKAVTIAAVRGAAVGAGMSLAPATDLRVLARNARLLSGFLRIGLHPGGGHFVLLSRPAGRSGGRRRDGPGGCGDRRRPGGGAGAGLGGRRRRRRRGPGDWSSPRRSPRTRPWPRCAASVWRPGRPPSAGTPRC